MAKSPAVKAPKGVNPDNHIRFDVEPDGSVNVVPVGFKGNSCKAATLQYEQALGHVQSRQDNAVPNVIGVKAKARN